ncbi:MAG: molybdopterin molybdotransferase MoeA [Blastocatellia bacterium]
MISISKALDIIKRETGTLGSERVELADAGGRVLTEDIVADSDLPPFDRSQMDGYAVKAADTINVPARLKIVGESAAGRGWHKLLKKGEAVRIMTGAPVPKGADAVQKIEAAIETDGFVTIKESTEKGRFIILKGQEVKKGKVVIRKCTVLTERMIAIPAAFGYAKISVAKRPGVAILSTGSEIVELNKKPKKDQIRNSNSVMLKVLFEKSGALTKSFPIIGDNLSELKSQISDATSNSDILITTGGVSVGKYDLTKLALKELGATIFFERVRLKPGKPTVFAKLGKTLIFGLPGNPVSAAVTFYLFVRKAILQMQSAAYSDLKNGTAITSKPVRGANERDTYLPASITTGNSGSSFAEPLNWQGSSDFIGFARADALIFVPRGQSFESGSAIKVLYL